MKSKGAALVFLKVLAAMAGRRFVFSNLAFLGCFAAGTLVSAQARVVIDLSADANSVERVAAEELTSHLHTLYPGTKFEVGSANSSDLTVYFGTVQELPAKVAVEVKGGLTTSESYVVRAPGGVRAHEAVIAGGSPQALSFAVDALLEKLGFGIYLSFNTAPPPSHAAFTFAGWDLEDAPLVGERVIFDWHNFLSDARRGIWRNGSNGCCRRNGCALTQ